MPRDYMHREDMGLKGSPVFEELDKGSSKELTLTPVMTGEAFSKHVEFPVIVEAWEHRRYGLCRRRYFVEFTAAERRKIGRLHTRFRKWYLISGVPDRVMFRLSTMQLIQRAIVFFASA